MALLFVTLPFVVRAVQPILIELDQDMEEAAASLGAGPLTIFRRVVLPNLTPAITAGVALAFARAIGEFGSLILISNNIPFETEVASVFIFKQVEAGNETAAAAVSVVLLTVSVAVLFADQLVREEVGRAMSADAARPQKNIVRGGRASRDRPALGRARLPRGAADHSR